MLNYHISLGDVLGLTPEQSEFLYAGLEWWGVVKTHYPELEAKAKWDQLRRMIPSGDGDRVQEGNGEAEETQG